MSGEGHFVSGRLKLLSVCLFCIIMFSCLRVMCNNPIAFLFVFWGEPFLFQKWELGCLCCWILKCQSAADENTYSCRQTGYILKTGFVKKKDSMLSGLCLGLVCPTKYTVDYQDISLSIVSSMWMILSLDLFHKGTNTSDTNLTVCGQLPFTHYTSVTGPIDERETAACSHSQLLNSGKQKQRLLFVKAEKMLFFLVLKIWIELNWIELLDTREAEMHFDM